MISTNIRATGVHDVADAVQEAARSDEPLRFRGAGSWMHGGGPFADATTLDLGGLSDVIEYVPGDLVITVGAGMPLDTLRSITAEHGQMLAVDPFGAPTGTIGACVATATDAPLAPSALQMRDLVLGIETVIGTGEATRAGGRVVKNVAGFDLVRLHTGAWGTLGALTAVSLRLHARPTVDHVITATCRMDVADAAFGTFLDQLVANRAPLPMLVVMRPAAAPRLVVRVSGNPARADALAARVVAFGVDALQEHSVSDTIDALRVAPPDMSILRLRLPLRHAALLVRGTREALPDATLLFDPARGALRVLTREDAGVAAERVRDTVHHLSGGTTPDTRVRIAIDQGRAAPVMRTHLEQRVKDALDPRNVCNRLRDIGSTSPSSSLTLSAEAP